MIGEYSFRLPFMIASAIGVPDLTRGCGLKNVARTSRAIDGHAQHPTATSAVSTNNERRENWGPGIGDYAFGGRFGLVIHAQTEPPTIMPSGAVPKTAYNPQRFWSGQRTLQNK
jgi:hypothetical protein